MKYIKLFENFNKSKLKKELDEYGIENYIINSDSTIDVNGDVRARYNGEICFNFNKVIGEFDCSFEKLKSLKNSPNYIDGDFFCNDNELINLIGSPKEVSGDFICRNNKLQSLEGMPLEIGRDFFCHNNPELKELNSVSNIEGFIYCDPWLDISKFRGYCKGFKIQQVDKNSWVDFKMDESTRYERYIKILKSRKFTKPKFNLDDQLRSTINNYKEGQIYH